MADTILQRQTYQAGDRIFKEGDEGNMAYIVQSGEVEIVKEIDRVETVLGTVGQGGIFGEMALIDDQPRMATARAASGATLIVIDRTMFHGKLAKCDPFIRGLLGIFAKNIRSMVERQLGS